MSEVTQELPAADVVPSPGAPAAPTTTEATPHHEEQPLQQPSEPAADVPDTPCGSDEAELLPSGISLAAGLGSYPCGQQPARLSCSAAPAGRSMSGEVRLSQQQLSTVPEQLRSLASLRDHCHKDGNYRAAAEAQQELLRLKDQEGACQMQALVERQREEASALEADYQREYQAFVDGWQARVAAARQKASHQESSLQAKQAAELEALRLRHGMQALRPKFSNELLILKQKASALARQREFDKAEQVKSRAELLERAELAVLRQEHEARQAGEVDQLAAQHQRELDALVRRLTGVRNDLLAAQQEELEVFSRKFQASKLALERSQATRRLLAEQAIRAALGLKRPKSPGSSIADNGSAGGAAGRLAADGPGSSRRSPYTSARGSPKSGGGRGESPGKARPGASYASPLKASLAGLALQAGERRPGSSPPQSSGGSRRGRV